MIAVVIAVVAGLAVFAFLQSAASWVGHWIATHQNRKAARP